MMPNVKRGDRMTGLLCYLAGPGRHNEHEEPHLVEGDDSLMAWYGDNVLDGDAAKAIARHLDRPHKALDVDVPSGHVWHCSLALRPDEGMLTDERWGAIAKDFIAMMEFDDNQASKAPCRWVAVRHGLSVKGNDHIHVVVGLVREDGTKASIHTDFHRAQVAARALETRYGLEELESVRAERSTRGYNPAERQAQARARARAKYQRAHKSEVDAPSWDALTGEDRRTRIAAELRTDEPRYVLALKVRGCAAAAGDEAEFVRRLRRAGLILRPRYAEGHTDVIQGYSVAERPEAGERPIWYAGRHLSRDLSLPRLRDGWPDTPTGATEAAAEWNAARRGRRVVAPGREAVEPDPQLWDKRNSEVSQLVDRLHQVPVEDRDLWATIARQTAGALAAWSNATEDTPGDLAAAADALSRSAQTFRRTVRPQKAGSVAISGAALLLASATHGGRGTVGQAVMVRQLLRLTQAVHDASVAALQTRQARLLAEDTRTRLVRIRDAMPGPQHMERVAEPGRVQSATATARRDLDPEVQGMLDRLHAGEAKPATQAVSPVPTKIEPARRPASAKSGAEHGVER